MLQRFRVFSSISEYILRWTIHLLKYHVFTRIDYNNRWIFFFSCHPTNWTKRSEATRGRGAILRKRETSNLKVAVRFPNQGKESTYIIHRCKFESIGILCYIRGNDIRSSDKFTGVLPNNERKHIVQFVSPKRTIPFRDRLSCKLLCDRKSYSSVLRAANFPHRAHIQRPLFITVNRPSYFSMSATYDLWATVWRDGTRTLRTRLSESAFGRSAGNCAGKRERIVTLGHSFYMEQNEPRASYSDDDRTRVQRLS